MSEEGAPYRKISHLGPEKKVSIRISGAAGSPRPLKIGA